MSVAQRQMVNISIFVTTRPLLDVTLLALVTIIFLLFGQSDFSAVYFYVVVVAIISSRLLDDMGFTQTPGNTAIVVFYISFADAVRTIGPMQ